MRVLVIGSDGQVGEELMRLGIDGCELIPANRQALDLSQAQSIENGFASFSPDLVVNCAAYTAVDNAEDESEVAYSVNAQGPKYLAQLCNQAGIALIHLSTDYVFDGAKVGPYLPNDPVQPLGVYGASKEAGERAVREQCPSHVILRTAWVFSARGNNFVKTMLRVGKREKHLRVVADQIGRPTSAHDLALSIAAVVTRVRDGYKPWGTYHFCNRGAVSWCDFAEHIFVTAKKYWGYRPNVLAISTDEYLNKVARPANSVLSTETFEAEFVLRPRPWQLALEDVLHELFKAKGEAQ